MKLKLLWDQSPCQHGTVVRLSEKNEATFIDTTMYAVIRLKAIVAMQCNHFQSFPHLPWEKRCSVHGRFSCSRCAL